MNNRPHISKVLRMKVWDKYISLEKGCSKCICGTTIYQLAFECGHIEPFSKGGKTNIDNLIPICASCNKSMGNTNYYEFLSKINNNDDDFILIDNYKEIDNTSYYSYRYKIYHTFKYFLNLVIK